MSWKNERGLYIMFRIAVVWQILAYAGFLIFIFAYASSPTTLPVNAWCLVNIILLCVGFMGFARFIYKRLKESSDMDGASSLTSAMALIRRLTITAVVISIAILVGIIVVAVLSFMSLSANGETQGLIRNIVYRGYEWAMIFLMLWYIFPRESVSKEEKKVETDYSTATATSTTSVSSSASSASEAD
jgi:Kef-type K+ transport system membrane component KefB